MTEINWNSMYTALVEEIKTFSPAVPQAYKMKVYTELAILYENFIYTAKKYLFADYIHDIYP